jgi:predicted nuclease with RNAse H fold
MPKWMGVDVGGKRKRFDVALIDDSRLLELRDRQRVEDVVAWVDSVRPTIVAIDSPRACAPPGHRVRPDERALRVAVCGIRWTPSREQLDGSDYYEWIREGLRLYEALDGIGAEVVECFPTASWTRWYCERSGRPRSSWTSAALAQQDLEDLPTRTNQDQRDAVAAALTAREFTHGRCERFGDIVVPDGSRPSRRGDSNP